MDASTTDRVYAILFQQPLLDPLRVGIRRHALQPKAGDRAVPGQVIWDANFHIGQVTHRIDPSVTKRTHMRLFRGCSHGKMELNGLGYVQHCREIDRTRRNPRRDVITRILVIVVRHVDVHDPGSADVHRPCAERSGGDKIRAEIVDLEIEAGDAVYGVDDGVNSALACHGHDFPHRRDQSGAVRDLGHQQQLRVGRTSESFLIGGQYVGRSGRLWHRKFHHSQRPGDDCRDLQIGSKPQGELAREAPVPLAIGHIVDGPGLDHGSL